MKRINTFLAFTLFCTCLAAQGTLADYRRAYGLYERCKPSLVSGWVKEVKWTDDTTYVLSYHSDAPKPPQTKLSDDRLHHYNAATKQGPQRIERHWMNEDDERWGVPVLSPDSTMVAYIRNDNVWVSLRDGSQERVLSEDGTLSAYYSARLQWSPDGRYVAACRIRPVSQKRYVYYVESSPSSQLQPILHQQEYAKPGDERTQRTPCIFEVSTGRRVIPDNSLFSRQYDLWGPEWLHDSRTLVFEYNERGHKVFRVLALDAESGKVRTLIEERSETFVNYSRHFRHQLDEDTKMLWMSERDGWNHLYVFDIKTGRMLRQLTRGEWVVRQVLKVDEEHGRVFFTASGMHEGEDPYHVHYCVVGLDGKGLRELTPEPANHSATFNGSFTRFVDTYSRADLPPVTVERRVDGDSQPKVLAQADISGILENGWRAPEVFVAPGRDGKTPMWGLIYRPTNFDASRSYPVIEYIYSGPGDAYVPKSFQSFNGYISALCELGFIVVQLDAMGTSYRGKAFEDVCYKNLKDAGLPDRKEWIRAAARRYPYMDIERVGIFGCSAGGQESTTAVLLHGDFYKAAFSACGCHDNRMDKIWWNEQWMGYPVDSSYVECSNVENAHLLQRPLMLLVGELDDNVDPASTMQVVAALVKAGKDIELVVLPGEHHTMGGTYGEHKRFDFFVRHLMGVEPPAWADIK